MRGLQRDRTIGQVLQDALELLTGNIGVVFALTLAVVVPIEFLVEGIGMGQLTARYESEAPVGEAFFSSGVSVLITTPLVTGMLVRLALDADEGREVSARRCWRTGLDVFAPLLLTVGLSVAGILLGFLALIVPGVILAVRWAVVAPVVVAEGLSGTAALRRSAALAAGNAWWVLGALVTITILSGIAGSLIAIPFASFADAADAQAVLLVGQALGQAISLPFSALATIVVFFTLRARHGDSTTLSPAVAAPGEEDASVIPPGRGAADSGGDREDPAGGEPPLPGGWQPPVPPR